MAPEKQVSNTVPMGVRSSQGNTMRTLMQAHMMIALLTLLLSSSVQAQQTAAGSETTVVPPLVNFSGVLADLHGKPLTDVTRVTFSLYQNQQGGTSLWTETQTVQPDQSGHYWVMLGASTSTGLPSALFAAGEARWLGVEAEGQPEQTRVLLVSVPYALKAVDAQTVGGLPPSAFMLAAPANDRATTASVKPAAATPAVGGSGTTDFIALWTDSVGDLGNSAIFQSGSGATAKIGINTTTPASTLDVKGSGTIRGPLKLPSAGTATSTTGVKSQPFTQAASVFNSGTAAAVAETFQWQAEPVGNNTASTSGSLNLLFASGTAAPAETGFSIAGNGLITFAPSQTFPGAGSGTVTSVGSGAGLTGGPITGSGSLSIAAGGVTNAMLQNPSVNVVAGMDLTGGGTVALGGTTTLNLDTTKVPQLGASNNFTGTETMTANTGTQVLSVTQSGGTGSGIAASTNSATGYGVVANATATTGAAVGVSGTTAAPIGNGVQGIATSTAGGLNGANGVYGLSSSPVGYGVQGFSNTNVGVYGSTGGTTLTSYGVEGAALSGAGSGVYGVGNGNGVLGQAIGGSGTGGTFYGGPGGGYGLEAAGGNDTTGAGGGPGGFFQGGSSSKTSGGSGVIGFAGPGVISFISPVAGVGGVSAGQGPGVLGADGAFSSTGSSFMSADVGVLGDASNASAAYGVLATGDNISAIGAYDDSSGYPTINAFNYSTSSTAMVFRGGTSAIENPAVIGGAGCGTTYMGLQLGLSGMSNCSNYTLLGDSNGNTYVNASGTTGSIAFRINNNGVTGLAGAMVVNHDLSVSIGKLNVTQTLTKPAGSFKIDHPLDPANKYLYHSFVESPDMKNIYDGTVTSDGTGLATVALPDWFESLNRDFRYQLTVIGQFAQAIVASEISNNRFTIRTDKPNVKVSWQVTGIRQDAFANANRIQVEVEKNPADRGRYLYPELFNAPETARIGYQEPPSATEAPERKPAEASLPRNVIPVIRPGMIPPRPPVPKLPAPAIGAKPNAAQTSK